MNEQEGIMKANIDYMLDAIYKPFYELGNCTKVLPAGIAGV
jgi:hypothetical protein